MLLLHYNLYKLFPEGAIRMRHKMKTLILVFGTMAILTLIFAAPCLAQLKFAYIRPDYILSKYEPFQEAMKQFDTYEKSETSKLQVRADAFQKKVVEAQKGFALMKEDQQKTISENLEKERTDLEKSSEELYNRDTGVLAKKHADLAQPIFDRLNRVLDRVGKEEKYDFIFDAGKGSLLFADQKFDISDHIFDELKKEPVSSPSTTKKEPAIPKKPSNTPK
jgi:outer membrane protein